MAIIVQVTGVTMQNVMDLARLDLNDSAKVRHTDVNVLRFANDGVAKVLVMRPDLNFGNYGNEYVDLAAGAAFPLSLEYRPAIANYIVMRCEVADDPFANEQRAIQGLKLFINDIGMA